MREVRGGVTNDRIMRDLHAIRILSVPEIRIAITLELGHAALVVRLGIVRVGRHLQAGSLGGRTKALGRRGKADSR